MKIFIRNIGLALLALFCLPPSTFPQKGKSQFPSIWGRVRDSLPRTGSWGAKILEAIKVNTSKFIQIQRIDEYDVWFSIGQSEKATYSVLKNLYNVNYGNRGPAHERMTFFLKNAQVIGNTTYELTLEDCFKNKELDVLENYLKENHAESFNTIWEQIQLNEVLWKVTSDSLVLYFPNTALNMGYVEFNYAYNKYAIAKDELGRSFLNERRRKRQLLRD